MPYIPRPKKNKPQKTPNYQKRRKIYQSKRWEKLRNAHLVAHPLCYICERMGIFNSAVDIHHIKHLENYEGLELESIAYNPSNLLSLCKLHHALLHTQYKNVNTIEGINKVADELKKNNKKKIFEL